jgi:hypothetical protein
MSLWSGKEGKQKEEEQEWSVFRNDIIIIARRCRTRLDARDMSTLSTIQTMHQSQTEQTGNDEATA